MWKSGWSGLRCIQWTNPGKNYVEDTKGMIYTWTHLDTQEWTSNQCRPE